MRVPNSINHQSSVSILSSLLQLHQHDVQFYRDASRMLKGSGQFDQFFAQLADYRQALAQEIETELSSLNAGVSTPSHDGVSYLKEQADAFGKALNSHNHSQIADITFKNEHQLSDYYRRALDTADELPENVLSLLEQQHQVVLEWERKTDRLSRVPDSPNSTFMGLGDE